MARIKLIVTGDMEKLALHESLRRVFPSQRGDDKVVWDKPRKLNGTTSHKLRLDGSPSQPMLDLAQAMLSEAGIGKEGDPADLVVVVDDLELGNLGQEQVVVQHFRAAVNARINSFSPTAQQRYRNLIREKCSFHLMSPMVESYLFGDAKALGTAGVPSGQVPMLIYPDVEQFETNDPIWLPTCNRENAARQQVAPWWKHERHPKYYLEHLAERGNVFYEETDHGKRALQGLRWSQVPKSSLDTPLIRALFEDLSDWFGVLSPLGQGSYHPVLYPLKSVNRASLLLRNL